MKIVLPGGTGQVGTVLERALSAAGHEVVVLTRRPTRPGQVGWGSDTELLLKSRRVVPGRLLEAAFTFGRPRWPEAADDLVRRVRIRPRASRTVRRGVVVTAGAPRGDGAG